MKHIYEALMNIQSELKAPKNQRNNFGGYNYRSCEDIMEAVKPLLLKNGVVLTVSDDMSVIGDRVYVKATATLADGEDVISNSAFAREAEAKKGMDDSQITGATSSYARKYALNGLFCIDDTKDADATNTHGKDDKTPAEKAKETREANKKAFEERFSKMYAYFKGTPKWSYDLETRFNSVMKEAVANKYEDAKCLEMLEIFDKLEKDSIVY
jgi:hypothetical protein